MSVGFDSSGNPYFSPDGNNLEFHYFNGSAVPYMNIWDYVESLLCYADYYGGTYNYDIELDGYVFQIETENSFDSRCFVDFENQTITFKDRDAFMDFLTYTECPLTGGIQGGEEYFINPEYDYVAPTNDLVIDLSKYGITAYFENDNGYLPYDVFVAFLNPYNLLPSYTYNGKYLYNYTKGSSDDSYLKLYQKIRGEALCLTEEYMEFTYNLLALNLDYNFGLDQRQLRASSGTKKYFKDGALNALAPYHDNLVSTDLNVSNNELIKVGAELLDDGGHAGYFGVANFLCSQAPEYSYSTVGPEYKNTVMSHSYSSYFRNEYEKSPAQLTGSSSAEAAYVEQDGVAFVVFDGFEAPSSTLSDNDITSSNYWQDTISLTHWANEQVRAHGIKNVVIDLSNNGGGVVFTEEFIASWLCGSEGVGNTSVYRNPKTGAYVKCNFKADVNLDGRFDYLDYLPSDVKVYCIIDNGSFSCGNKLPTDISENRETFFIGSRTGGGSCCVGSIDTALGSEMRSSMPFQIGMPSATSTNFVSNEKGVTADFWNIGNDLYNLSNLYDWNTIIAKIKANA